jgi:perosamine synthetase
MIPYGKQHIDEDDIQAVVEVLKSDWLTTGPKVDEFEVAFSELVGSKFGVAVSSGTAALHSIIHALNIGYGDEVIVPTMTFAATANCVLYQGGKPVFADVHPDTLLIDPEDVKRKISDKTKAIIAVDYAGQPCNYGELRRICAQHGTALVDDACHALGASYNGKRVGSIADMTAFSFHPVKNITTGEGGMVVTDSPEFFDKLKRFRNHGIDTDHRQREREESWYYELVDLGFNYRITDIQCALGISQLKKLPEFLLKRRKIAKLYDQAFADSSVIHPLKVDTNIYHAYHLYVISVDFDKIVKTRQEVFKTLRTNDIGVNVHYIPVHLHPYYSKFLDTSKVDCPVAERMYEKILSIPIYPSMTLEQVNDVIEKIFKTILS